MRLFLELGGGGYLEQGFCSLRDIAVVRGRLVKWGLVGRRVCLADRIYFIVGKSWR